MRPSGFELATAIEILLGQLKPFLSDEEFDKLCTGNQIIEEVNLYGPAGPVGLGLGFYGGHVV